MESENQELLRHIEELFDSHDEECEKCAHKKEDSQVNYRNCEVLEGDYPLDDCPGVRRYFP